jgi:alkylation response protein AidB-like acyl-CoA dehydrogenase
MRRGGAPRLISFGLKMIAPVLMAFGNPAQQQRFLPKIMSAEEWWCQGYSEPGAGSDLASLKTPRAVEARATTTSSMARRPGPRSASTPTGSSAWCAPTPRPSAARHLLPADRHEIARRHRAADHHAGRRARGQRVWLEDVKVPAENLVGEENKGWTCAKFLLGHERTNIAGIGIAKRELARLKRIAAADEARRPLLEDPLFAARVAQVEIDLMALEITNLRVLSAEAKNKAPGPEASILKIKGTEIQQAISRTDDAGRRPLRPALRQVRRRPRLRRQPRRPATATCASCRSSAAPTKSRRTSSRR